MTRSRPRFAACTVAIALVAVILPGSAWGSGHRIGQGRDDRNDVHLLRDTDAISAADRRSVDLRRLTITHTSRGLVFQLRLRQVASRGSYDQYFFVYLEPRGDTPGIGYLKLKASTLRGDGGYDLQSDVATCRVTARVSRGRSAITTRLPWRCVPQISARVRAIAYTTPLGREGGSTLYSRDRMHLTRPVDLRR